MSKSAYTHTWFFGFAFQGIKPPNAKEIVIFCQKYFRRAVFVYLLAGCITANKIFLEITFNLRVNRARD